MSEKQPVPDDGEPKIFSQTQVSFLMMDHRKKLQARVKELEATVDLLRQQIVALTVPEVNPLLKIMLNEIRSLKGHVNE